MLVVQTTAQSPMYCTERNFGCLEEHKRSLVQVHIIRIKFIFITLFHWITWLHCLHADEVLIKVSIDTDV